MKRGRPNSRVLIQESVIDALKSLSTPITISALTEIISGKFNKPVSWNTIQKYVLELVEMDKIQPTPLPHSKIEGKNGLTVYQLKR
jgi:hypothetical protein